MKCVEHLVGFLVTCTFGVLLPAPPPTPPTPWMNKDSAAFLGFCLHLRGGDQTAPRVTRGYSQRAFSNARLELCTGKIRAASTLASSTGERKAKAAAITTRRRSSSAPAAPPAAAATKACENVTSPRNTTSRHTRAGSSGQDVQACRAWVVLCCGLLCFAKYNYILSIRVASSALSTATVVAVH